MDETAGPFASRTRAVEIALMEGKHFGLAEFTELTGVRVPGLGIYRVGATRISIGPAENLGYWAPAEQHRIHQAVRLLTLTFPCTTAAFLTWYGAIRGTNGVSDIPLAPGFAEELQRLEGSASQTPRPSVPSGEIVAAFKQLPDPTANRRWWDLRLRNPGRYGLTSGRAQMGGYLLHSALVSKPPG